LAFSDSSLSGTSLFQALASSCEHRHHAPFSPRDDHLGIISIAEEHIPGFRDALDVVAREKKFLAFLEAPPLEDTRLALF
jgi:hypothetical protein